MSTVHVYKKDGGCEVIKNVEGIDFREGVLKIYGSEADLYYAPNTWVEVSEIH